MLAHILAWWEEAMPIILAIAEGREYERKKYDFDAFNAEAVARYATRYPAVTLELHLTGRVVDLVAERFDAGVRLAETIEPDLAAMGFDDGFADA